MIKLENTGALPQSRVMLAIQSETDTPSLSLSAEPFSEFGEDEKWGESKSHLMQKVSGFVRGAAFTMEGKVLQHDAVAVAGAHKVVVEIVLAEQTLGAFAAGKKSKTVQTVNLVRVVEVWGSPTKRLWSALDGGNGATAKPAASLDASGRIVKPEVVRT
jgi:hypothetical protein